MMIEGIGKDIDARKNISFASITHDIATRIQEKLKQI